MPAVCRDLRDATTSDKLSSLDDQNKCIHDFVNVICSFTNHGTSYDHTKNECDIDCSIKAISIKFFFAKEL